MSVLMSGIVSITHTSLLYNLYADPGRSICSPSWSQGDLTVSGQRVPPDHVSSTVALTTTRRYFQELIRH
jgi:hypothetical protein